ncbi:MAG: SufD family Fe-S cluster assembly protein, partial [Anaeroplasmataceae bacterium]|nr:SufD family Fe-S cluster assembly protein [Anaeroplasmataceae bacterium]
IEDYILVEQNTKLIIEKNIKMKILDCSNDSTIEMMINEDADVEYQILNSKNSKRFIQCKGKINITQISLEPTVEELNLILQSPNADAKVELLSLGNAFSQVFKQSIWHNQKNTISNISNFGVAINKASILFDTTGKIDKGMAKSKCSQLSKGIVMDDTSSITSKPILLIDEYDVIANHGASIGKMSDESLFYLMSRGLTKQEAFLLILEGIIGPFVQKIFDEGLKNSINQKLEQWIKR